MTTTITIDAGTLLFAAEDDMTATGLLVPYGVEARSNLGTFTVDPGVIEIPADLTGASLNLEHSREDVVGGIERAWEQPEAGILAAFRFASTPEGIAARDEARAGKRRHLSVEAKGVRIKDGRAVSGRLFAAALVGTPAFPGATLLAAAPDTEPSTAGDETPEPPAVEPTDPEHIEILADVLPNDVTVVTPEGATVYEPTASPEAEETNTEGSGTLTATATTPGSVPATLLASGSAPESPITTTPRETDARTLFASFARVKAGLGTTEDTTLLAAFSNITMGGGGAAQLPATGVLRPAWLGELYNGVPYEREYITLHKLGTDITAGGKSGFQLGRGANEAGEVAHFTGDWNGNKADVASGQGFTKVLASTLDKYAFGSSLGREFFDLPGGAETVEAWFRLVLEDHLYWSDQKALALIIATAGAPVAAATAQYSTKYPAAVGQLIQGILAVKRPKADGRKDVPTYAIANTKAYEELIYAAGGEENLPAFVNLVVTTASRGAVDGVVNIVEGSTGIVNTRSVIVGSENAIEFDELPGGPLTVDALELAKGGVDRAVHGYLQKFVKRPEGIVKIGTADV